MNKLFCAVALGLVLVACGESLTDVQYLEKAQTHFDQGDVKSAVIEAKNALSINPDNGQARVLLGKSQLLAGNPGAAEKEFAAAAKLGVPETVFQTELSEALLQQGKRDEVRALSASQLEGRGKAKFLANQASAFLSDNDLGQAKLLIDEALSIAPDSIPALLVKSRLHIDSRELEQARDVLGTVLGMEEKNPRAWSLMGDVERLSGNVEAAVDAFGKAVDLGGANSYHLLKRAEALIQYKRFDQAQKDVDILLKRESKSPLVNFAAGQLQLVANKIDEAQVSFEKVVRVQADFAPALYPLASIHFQKGSYERAEQYATKFINQKPDSVQGQRLLALVQYRNQKFDEAEAVLQNLLSEQPNDPAALNLLASVFHQQGKKAESLVLLQKIAKDFPESAYAQLRFGAGLLSVGDQKAGEAQMEQAIALNPEFHQAEVVLILHHLQQKEFDRALSVANAYRDKKPEQALPYNLIGQVHAGAQNWSEARLAFSKAMSLVPGDIASNNAMALMSIRDQKLEDARGYYQSILQHHRNHLGSLMRLAALDVMEGKPDSMMKTLERAIEAHPDALMPRLVMARHLMAQGEPEKVAQMFQGMDKAVNQNSGALEVIAASQLARQEFAGAKLTLEKLEAINPNSAGAQYLLANAYAGVKNLKKMESALNKALNLQPDYFDARLALAQYLVNEDVEEAKNHLKKLKLVAPNHAAVNRLDAAILNEQGDQGKALLVYQRVFNENPESQNLILLARQHIYMKERGKAIALLEEWLQKKPKDIAARSLLANEYIVLEKSDDVVVAQYQKILDQEPNNLLALNNMAWHLREIDPKAALRHAQKALEIQPESASILDTVAVLHLRNGNLLEARRAIRKALKRAPENPNVNYHAAMIEVEAGEDLAARERLTTLLQEAGEFPLRREAMQLLEKLE